MKSKVLALIMATAFTLGSVGMGWAASVKCTVEKVEGETVTLNCGSKADQLKVGSKVKVKASRAAAIEGC